MNTKQAIRQSLTSIMSEGDANACAIWKGWGGKKEGWHYTPFSQQPVFLGRNREDALQRIGEIAEHQAEVRSGDA
jgi:hypothetical protein